MKIKINNTTLSNVKILTTPEERSEGMMFKCFDDNLDGMLFIMEGYEQQSFWMKNCIVPLDIIFIKNNIIESISEKCPPCKHNDCPSYDGYGNIVLEVKGGFCSENNIKVGDKVVYLKNSL